MLKLAFLVLAYLYGSLPITEEMAKRKGVDLRKSGTGKVGSGNLWQTAGATYGIIGGLTDLGKGAVPPLVARALGFNNAVASAAAAAGVAGQMWPVFRRFDGGRGNSSTLGLALALSPRSLLLSAIPMLAGAAVWSFPIMAQRHLPWKQRFKFRSRHSDEIPIGMMAGWLGLPLFAWIMREPRPVVRACAVVFLLLVLRRATDKLDQDLASGASLKHTLLNRVLYDRSHH